MKEPGSPEQPKLFQPDQIQSETGSKRDPGLKPRNISAPPPTEDKIHPGYKSRLIPTERDITSEQALREDAKRKLQGRPVELRRPKPRV